MKRVRISRPHQSDYWQIEELECPCCHQLTRREFEQPDMFREGVTHVKTDCLNPHCDAYYMTLGLDAFMARFQQDAS